MLQLLHEHKFSTEKVILGYHSIFANTDTLVTSEHMIVSIINGFFCVQDQMLNTISCMLFHLPVYLVGCSIPGKDNQHICKSTVSYPAFLSLKYPASVYLNV